MSRHLLAVRWYHHRAVRRDAFGSPLSSEDWGTKHLVARDAPAHTCTEGDTSPECELPAGSASKLPMILGALFPILAACIVLFFLHRRHMRRLKAEDATDKTKSMDFGMDLGPASRMHAEKGGDSRSRRQLSMDMDIVASPYLLPQAVGSHDSLARTVHSVDDRYGRPGGPMSPTVAPRTARRDSSTYTRSLRPDDSPDGSRSNMDAGLLAGAQRMPTSTPPPPRGQSNVPQINLPMPPRAKSPAVNEVSAHTRDAYDRHSQEPVAPRPMKPVSPSPFADPVITPSSPPQSSAGIEFRFDETPADNDVPDNKSQHSTLAPAGMDNRRLSMGFRPLPPDGSADESADARASRIRSFYKEYFDNEQSQAPPIPVAPAQYLPQTFATQDYGPGFDDNSIYSVPKPFAEPPTRRAMTPPPRAPPRGMDSRAGSAAGGRYNLHQDPRSYSSASHRPGPRRPIEPPQPLMNLPTPSKLTEDAFNSTHMFAPDMRIVRDGRGNDMHGGLRPYSPSVSAHVPLATSYDDLPMIPSPHMLRNSSTFTSLDFAPPRKFKNEGDVSDAGSVHSSGTGVSALQTQNIRAGAYRVSRIPTDVVPLRDDMTAGLKPTWDMGYGKST
ncbi:hypothetical protein FPQ18DRAFT_264599 [Pyronema domesticum]|uniref:Uncharacterized protein n=1 Tax=Pyronema omphalodes (strain CBS 100304) TaxID=1076935 RepID=U4LSI7_PYROM|nr:hypothetical protein FPQ18DRAFT_264599 [Pyronema domesticum]CCX34945.1 Similar to conserved hypothetical protein [Aspergillus flavus NRRL3357]; acc. no. XP_002377263 [Pyronema omphalodes CBS 100304]